MYEYSQGYCPEQAKICAKTVNILRCKPGVYGVRSCNDTFACTSSAFGAEGTWRPKCPDRLSKREGQVLGGADFALFSNNNGTIRHRDNHAALSDLLYTHEVD